MTKVWYAQCKPFSPEERSINNKELKEFQEECLINCSFGMGWHIDEFDAFLSEDKNYICDLLTNSFHQKKLELRKKKNETNGFTTAQNRYRRICEGDIVLTRFVGIYYWGIVAEKPFVIRGDNKFSWQSTVRDKWHEIGEMKDLPNSVRGWIGRTSSRGTVIDLDGLAEKAIMKLAGIQSEKMVLNEKNFVKAMSDGDLEDLVCQYMQIQCKEFVFLPSSCKKNTQGIEYIMYDPRTNDQIACQTKVDAQINIESYVVDKTFQRFKKIFLFSGTDKYSNKQINDTGNIEIIDRKELFELFKANEYFKDSLGSFFEY